MRALLLVLLFGAGCYRSVPAVDDPDAGRSIDAGRARPRDAGAPDVPEIVDPPPSPCDIFAVGRNLGSACRSETCQDPWTCMVEVLDVVLPTVRADGAEGPSIAANIFPGSECSVTCVLDGGGGECGECGTCSGIFVGDLELVLDIGPGGEPIGLCRPFCEVGGCREGYTCSPATGTCVEACLYDDQCRLTVEDVDGDGADDLVYLGEDARRACDLATGRCVAL